MRAGFSEFSFAYTLTEALVDFRWGARRIVPPPYFPTLPEERHVGYDVRLGPPGDYCFIQFKLCDGMVRHTAKEIAVADLELELPFLRMKLMPSGRSPQHERLVALEEGGERVFYAAPRFYEYDDFVEFYRQNRILENSVFVSPRDIGLLPDAKPHYVSFNSNADFGWVLSEPFKLERILDGSGLIESIETADLAQRPYARMRRALSSMLTALSETAVEEEGLADTPDELLFRRCAAIACNYFNAFMFPIYPVQAKP